jgi:hypothetical protein
MVVVLTVEVYFLGLHDSGLPGRRWFCGVLESCIDIVPAHVVSVIDQDLVRGQTEPKI